MPRQSGEGLDMLRSMWHYGQRCFGQGQQPKTRFVVFGSNRSGSALLEKLLKGHLLKQQLTQVDPGAFPRLLAQPRRFPLWYVHFQAMQSQSHLYGFKLSSEDLLQVQRMDAPAEFMTTLHRQGYQILYLRRAHLLRHAIALLKAQDFPTEKRSTEGTNRPKRLKRQPIYVSVPRLMETLAHLENQRIEEAAILAQVPYLELTYEVDLLDPNAYSATADKVAQFLHISIERFATPKLSLVHQQLDDLIVNHQEVYQALEKSEFAYVLAQLPMQLVI
jgi:LPS sulfotransferase NodH